MLRIISTETIPIKRWFDDRGLSVSQMKLHTASRHLVIIPDDYKSFGMPLVGGPFQ